MNATANIQPALVPPGAGKTYVAFGDEITIHLSGEDTGGKFTLFTDVTPPGGGPPPHYHENEDETFIILEGRASILLEGAWHEATAGAIVYSPKGKTHTFKNIGDTPLKMLVQASPSGFEIFFARIADVFAQPGAPDMQRIIEIAGEHGVHFLSP